jgi:hypothetical protein
MGDSNQAESPVDKSCCLLEGNKMTDIVTDPGKSIVTSGNNNNQHYGLEGKDVSYLNANFNAQSDRHMIDVVLSGAKSGELATEKTAAATSLAVEKIAAAAALQAAFNTAAVQAGIAEGFCSVKALILEVEARGVRDQLAQVRDELVALKAKTP